jgi:hypothetical protein
LPAAARPDGQDLTALGLHQRLRGVCAKTWLAGLLLPHPVIVPFFA